MPSMSYGYKPEYCGLLSPKGFLALLQPPFEKRSIVRLYARAPAACAMCVPVAKA